MVEEMLLEMLTKLKDQNVLPLPPFLRRRKAKIYKQIKDIFLTTINNE